MKKILRGLRLYQLEALRAQLEEDIRIYGSLPSERKLLKMIIKQEAKHRDFYAMKVKGYLKLV